MIPVEYDPDFDQDLDKVSPERRRAAKAIPMPWDLYLLSLFYGFSGSCTLSSTYRRDAPLSS